jgi:hypothetical protein
LGRIRPGDDVLFGGVVEITVLHIQSPLGKTK